MSPSPRSSASIILAKIYSKRFGRPRPEVVMSIEERHRVQQKKKEAKRAAKAARRAEEGSIERS